MNKPDVRRFKLGEEVGILSVWLVVLLAMCLLSDRFRTYGNLQILLLNGSVIAFLALGQAFVLLTGGVDLSTGFTVGETGVLWTVMQPVGVPWPDCSFIPLFPGVLLWPFYRAIVLYPYISRF